MHATEICSLITGCFNILTEKICRLTKVQAEAFYREHEGKPFFEELCSFMVSGPICALILEGENAVRRWRDLMGATDPLKAEQGTIRAQFGLGMPDNAVHGSADLAAAEREIPFFFAGMDIVDPF